ncbi:sigma-70 family RNA polymerase sigma factor [Neglecta sp. X4]|uniref:RNA polymerase sigma factor n=1 Tax=unclassified Neglectibacter TaxID=2632164 RepID=UPI00136FE7E1|nr:MULTISPECIES: sigma-70 family RNA polymerase sigma factor [unclassified Neglectibacter]NBI18909.1 sigma-70 family RNA polymerase sigma factor [Neglectibacter sp. 59]NBJ74583.1 sigma-70 family RNA polymerase sigma factor [Neglectibacter sp. X4]NCE82399.1 sigma-70 family RNA polymerase sigma factor [Neglectibacter sp. X58]
MAKSQFDVLKEEFQNKCKVINLKYEYEGYTGEEQWAIISELTKKELFEKYPEIVKQYMPFVLLSVEQGKAVYEFRRNESKFYKRSKYNEDAFGYDDELIGIFHSEVFVPDFFEQQITEEYEENRYQLKMKLLDKALSSLTEKQYKYLITRYVANKSAREIAEAEGVSHQAIEKHLNAAIKEVKKIFEGFFRK